LKITTFLVFLVALFRSHFKNVIALAVHIAADQGGRPNKNAEKMSTKKGFLNKVVKTLELL